MNTLLQKKAATCLTGKADSRLSKHNKLVCRAEVETKPVPSSAYAGLPKPDWLPEPVVPALEFLNATDFKLQETSLYKDTLAKYFENKYVKESVGWKPLAETINGRAAMIGFLTGALAEIFGAGPILLQLSKFPQPVLAAVLLITAGSIIPTVKGTEGNYLDSLKDTYTLPEGVFTEANERVHGRLAMVGLGSMILLELLKGSSVL